MGNGFLGFSGLDWVQRGVDVRGQDIAVQGIRLWVCDTAWTLDMRSKAPGLS